MHGNALPRLLTDVPGPHSRARVATLARHECPAITARRAQRARALGVGADDPVVWAEARGANVLDVDGNRFVDMTAGFGVALVGHRHPAVVAAADDQARRLVHAMGDAWPDASRIRLLERLARVAPRGLDVALLGLSGSDAVDAAIKTAIVATGRPGVIAFTGAYHGLALGVLALQDARPSFRAPFREVSHPHVRHLPWGCTLEALDAALDDTVGLVIAEPIQGRGGIRPAAPGWLAGVASRARAAGALFALDEIQTGCGRTGVWFAGPEAGVVPDLLCIGKALGGGYPVSACLGSRGTMDAWGRSTGEAIHTQTFLGHPIGNAAALAVITLLEDGLLDEIAERGARLGGALEAGGWPVRGQGLMRAVEVGGDALEISRGLLRKGWLVLPADATSLCLTPPVCLADAQIDGFAEALRVVVESA